MKTCSEVVGATLGPGGMSVVIERQEERLPPMVTKDGVTVFRNLGFDNSSMQVIMEAARDASVRTATEAGDGTTTATVLAEALVRQTMDFCDRNPKVSPQRVVRELERGFKQVLEPAIRGFATKVDLNSPEGRSSLRAVAKISANGDEALADAVLECFDVCGDEGNVTILESSGPSGYEVEHLEGYGISGGYEDSCGKFYQAFINEPARQETQLKDPSYILYHGRLNDIYSLLGFMEKVGNAMDAKEISNNVVLIATGFSETVLAHLATNFAHPETLNIFPLVAPMNGMRSSQYDFLQDCAALTGGHILDPLNAPFEAAEMTDLGRTEAFEASRFRSNIIGYRDELLVLERAAQLQTLLKSGSLSQYDASFVQERLGKISGGIAKLRVMGASAGELREKRDRAEDAICAVRGALKYGALPGGGWALLQLQMKLRGENQILKEVLGYSITDPVYRLFMNAGYAMEEIDPILETIRNSPKPLVYDVLEGKHVDPFVGGVLDSLPAVLEALRNSISIAALLGTCGGVVVFKRDAALDRQEARDTNEFLRNAGINEADERG